MAQLPGPTDLWLTITPRCRERPDEDVIEDTLGGVKESVEALLSVYQDDPDANIHIAVCIEKEPQ